MFVKNYLHTKSDAMWCVVPTTRVRTTFRTFTTSRILPFLPSVKKKEENLRFSTEVVFCFKILDSRHVALKLHQNKTCALMEDANLHFCKLKARTSMHLVGSRRGEHFWCKDLFDQLVDSKVNKRKLFIQNVL